MQDSPKNTNILPLHNSNMKTVESAVRERYAAGAKSTEPRLCCPVDYNSDYLKVIPEEVIERDYGCGDPSRYLREGEVLVDLGSGTGKICFIAAQVVGPKGRIIGVDMTDEMLAVARRNAPIVAERVGYANVEFRKGRIQDLALDLELLDRQLQSNPITDATSFLAAESWPKNCAVSIRSSRATRSMWSFPIVCSIWSSRNRSGNCSRKFSACSGRADAL